jgi:hypothetical protein
VLLNVTVVDPLDGNYVVTYPAGEAQPFASNVNAAPHQTVPNLVVAKVGAGGQVMMGNWGGASHLVVDITGWWDEDRTTKAGRHLPEFTPLRWMDTREVSDPVEDENYLAVRFGNFPPSFPWLMGQRGGSGSMVLNTTVIAVDGGGFAVVYPGDLGGSPPYASNLNFTPARPSPTSPCPAWAPTTG